MTVRHVLMLLGLVLVVCIPLAAEDITRVDFDDAVAEDPPGAREPPRT